MPSGFPSWHRSLSVTHPTPQAGRSFLRITNPRAVDAWRLRKALHHLGLSRREDLRREQRRRSSWPSSRFPPTRGPRPRPATGGLRRLPGDPHGAGRRSPAGCERHGDVARCVRCAPAIIGTIERIAGHRERSRRQLRPAARRRADRRRRCRRRPGPSGSLTRCARAPRCWGSRRAQRPPSNWPASRPAPPSRPPDRRNPRCGSGPGRPHDRPSSAAGPADATEDADAPDRHNDGDQTVNDGDQTAALSLARTMTCPEPLGLRRIQHR